MQLAFDHLAVAATNLEAGVAHVHAALGHELPRGGRHPLMATHNHLARLGEQEFLEIISIDPDATPQRPRWFALDQFGNAPPRLATWLVRTDDLDAALAELPSVCGSPVEVTRDELTWRVALPENGSMPFDGMFPTLIDWPMRPLPATSMADIGCTLERLDVHHPEAERIEELLGALLDDSRLRFVADDDIGLEAILATRHGARRLR